MNQRDWLEGQQFTKMGQKYPHDWLYLQLINSDKRLLQSPFKANFFRWRHLALASTKLISQWAGSTQLTGVRRGDDNESDNEPLDVGAVHSVWTRYSLIVSPHKSATPKNFKYNYHVTYNSLWYFMVSMSPCSYSVMQPAVQICIN